MFLSISQLPDHWILPGTGTGMDEGISVEATLPDRVIGVANIGGPVTNKPPC